MVLKNTRLERAALRAMRAHGRFSGEIFNLLQPIKTISTGISFLAST